MQPLLLISGTAPGEPGVGGVILNDIVQLAGAGNVHCVWLAPPGATHGRWLDQLPTTVLTRRYESGWRPLPGRLGEFAGRVATSMLHRRQTRSLAGEVMRLVRRLQPTSILCVLESPAAVRVMHRLAGRVDVPIRSIVWDDASVFCPPGKLDRWTRAAVRREFGEVLRRSRAVAVICENMADAYDREFGVCGQIVRHGVLPAPRGRRPAQQPNALRIGFAGSLTAADCMRCLMQCLDALDWRLDERDVCLRVLGPRLTLTAQSRRWIEYFGWRDHADTVELLNECDLLYLPQSFSAQLRTLSELSFPTKLSTYAATDVPILLHAPDYGSLTRFWKERPLGPVCQANVETELLAALRAGLAPTGEQQATWTAMRCSARCNVLGRDVFVRSVRRFLAECTDADTEFRGAAAAARVAASPEPALLEHD